MDEQPAFATEGREGLALQRGRLDQEIEAFGDRTIGWQTLRGVRGFTGLLHPGLECGDIDGQFGSDLVEGALTALAGALDGLVAKRRAVTGGTTHGGLLWPRPSVGGEATCSLTVGVTVL